MIVDAILEAAHASAKLTPEQFDRYRKALREQTDPMVFVRLVYASVALASAGLKTLPTQLLALARVGLQQGALQSAINEAGSHVPRPMPKNAAMSALTGTLAAPKPMGTRRK